jgi:hypothetical protein
LITPSGLSPRLNYLREEKYSGRGAPEPVNDGLVNYRWDTGAHFQKPQVSGREWQGLGLHVKEMNFV